MHLHAWLGVILSSAKGILSELLEAHRTVCLEKLWTGKTMFAFNCLISFLFVFQTAEITDALGDLFIYLFGEGFGSTEDTSEDADDEQQGAIETGTGLGDGDGGKSVSSKIDDPSQIEDMATVSVFKYILLTVTISVCFSLPLTFLMLSRMLRKSQIKLLKMMMKQLK
jgi:midasin